MEKSPNPLSAPQMPPFSEKLVTVPIRLDTVRIGTVQRTIRYDIELYNTAPDVFDAVQYGTNSSPDFQCYVITISVLVSTVREQFAKVREQCSPNPLFAHSGEHCS